MEQVRVRQGMTALGSLAVAGAVIAAYAVGSGGGTAAKADTAPPTTNVVTADGAGQVAGTPDTMVTTFTVVTKGANPGAALSSANVVMAKVQSTLKARGLAAKDLQTTGLSVNPNYVWSKNTQHLVGYAAEEDLRVTLRNLASAGKTISAATAVGGTAVTVGGLSLDLEGNSTLVTNARAAAFADAQAKAQQYAALAGRTLGALVSVTEHTDQTNPNQFGYAAASAAAAPAGVPIAAGSQNVAVNVTAVWSLN